MAEESRILDTVGQLYAGIEDNTAWIGALDAVSKLWGSAGASFEIVEKRTGRPVVIETGRRIESAAADTYLAHYGPLNPRVPAFINSPAGTVGYDHAIMSEVELDKDPFYAEFLSSLGFRYFLSGVVLSTEEHSGVLSIQRSSKQGHVNGDDIALMARLMPHLQQVADIRLRLGKALRRGAPFAQGLEHLGEGVFVVDGRGCVLHANGVADRLLSRDDGITLGEGRLQFRDKRATAAFSSALLGVTALTLRDEPAQSFPSLRTAEGRPYLVTVRAVSLPETELAPPGQAKALVFVRDPSELSDLDDELLRQSFGLTNAETKLASLVDRGLTLEEVAARRGVAITTVRTQLYSLMDKLGVNRQAQLIRLLGQYRRLM